jgi:hypothetical protein
VVVSLLIASTVLLPVSSVYADSGLSGFLQDDFCWNYFLVPCPDGIDFYWRTNAPLSPGEPSDSHDWASLVAPANTYFFYSPPPSGKHQSWNFGVAGWGYDWWVVPASGWWFNGSLQPGLALDTTLIPSTFKKFPQSSYGQPQSAPSGEPGIMTRSSVLWWGWLWDWHLQCSILPPGCYPVWHYYPLYAQRTNTHPVPVRQLLPIGVGT